jgi:hypothetical protein
MSVVTIYIPSLSRTTTKDDIINVFQVEHQIGSVEHIELLTETSNSFCDICRWKSDKAERRSCDVCLLRNKKRQIGAYVQVNLDLENEIALLILDAFGRNVFYNLRVIRYSDYEDRVTKIWCLTKTEVVLPLTFDNSPRIEVPPNTPTNSRIEEMVDKVTQFDLIYSDYDSELESKRESLSSSSSFEEESNHVLKRKLYEANQLLSIREKQIQELERQIKDLRFFALSP